MRAVPPAGSRGRALGGSSWGWSPLKLRAVTYPQKPLKSANSQFFSGYFVNHSSVLLKYRWTEAQPLNVVVYMMLQSCSGVRRQTGGWIIWGFLKTTKVASLYHTGTALRWQKYQPEHHSGHLHPWSWHSTLDNMMEVPSHLYWPSLLLTMCPTNYIVELHSLGPFYIIHWAPLVTDLLTNCSPIKKIFDLGIRIPIHSRDAPIV